MRGEETAVLAMGKLGGREMTATSDLDLILIYDFDDEHPESDGKRPLYGAQYFARLTQRLINALTAQTNYGALYQVDMRLRPSGPRRPAGDADRRLRRLSGDRGLDLGAHGAHARAGGVGVARVRARASRASSATSCGGRAMPTLIAGDVVEMRAAIAKEKGDSERWDLKYAAGGLVDIEFIAQYLQLVHAHAACPTFSIPRPRACSTRPGALRVLPVEDAEVLRPAVQLYHDLTQILRLCLPGPFDPKTAGAGLLRLLARAADVPDFATLDATLIETQAKVRASFVRILGKAP